MGIISNELKVILAQLEKSKASINNKYEIMGMTKLSSMSSNKLNEYIDEIPVINTSDATAKPTDIYYGRTAYVKAEKITGLWSYTELKNVDLINLYPVYNDSSITNKDIITAHVNVQEKENNHYTIDNDTVFSFNTLEFANQIGLSKDVLLKNHSVLNIHGTIADSSDATATANDIIAPKTAYANNEKITGTIIDRSSDNTIKLNKSFPQQSKLAGYYKYGISAEYSYFDIIYITNVEGTSAFVETYPYDNKGSFNITQSIPVCDGKNFKGWSLSPTDYSSIYTAGQNVSIYGFANRASVIVLYAIWKDNEAPNELTLEVSFLNNGQLNASGTETATVTLVGGDDPEGGSVTKSLEISGAASVSAISNNSYNVVFDKSGYFVAIGTSVDMFGAKVAATQTIEIKSASGSSSESGQFVDVTFDSDWVPVSVVNGCYISTWIYELQIPKGHTGTKDTMVVYGRKTNGDEIVLFDKFNSSNEGLLASEITPGAGDLSSTKWSITNEYSVIDDIRQVKFVATTPNHSGCVKNATLTFSIKLEYDTSLDSSISGIEAHVHNYSEYKTITEPTCTRTGVQYATCSSCFGTVKRTLNALGHEEDAGTAATEATCIQYGKMIYKCKRCDLVMRQATVKPLGHSYDDGVITKEPTETTSGVKTYTCIRCGMIKTEYIPATTIFPNITEEEPDAKYRWGYYELTKQTNSTKLIQAYNRIANMYNEGGACGRHDVTIFGTTTTQTFDTVTSHNIDGVTVFGLDVYLYDLGITPNDLKYIWGLVYCDYPEVLPRWTFTQITGPYIYYARDGVVVNVVLAHFPNNIRNDYLATINQTFSKIVSLVKEYYNIDYVEDSFYNNNRRYTESQMKKIGKVIHDFLVVNNTYGDANSTEGYNQILWPGMSEGAYNPVCASYAHAFKYCCWKFGINAVWVPGATGTARDGLHAWNMVMYKPYNVYDSQFHVSSNWQEVDITWDDPTFVSGIRPSYCSWKYFNKTTSFMTQETHVKAIYSSTSYGVEKYKTFPANGNCNCTSNTYAITNTDEGGTLYLGA